MRNLNFNRLFILIFVGLVTLTGLIDPSITVHATDYATIAIAKASTNINNSYVFQNFLYVYNDTSVLKYSLLTGTQVDALDLGAGVTCNQICGQGDKLYLEVIESGTTKIVAVSLEGFYEIGRIDVAFLIYRTASYDNVENIAVHEYEGNLYWAYSTTAATFKKTLKTVATYESDNSQSFTGMIHIYKTSGTYHLITYVYNASDDSHTNYDQSLTVIGSLYVSDAMLRINLVSSYIDCVKSACTGSSQADIYNYAGYTYLNHTYVSLLRVAVKVHTLLNLSSYAEPVGSTTNDKILMDLTGYQGLYEGSTPTKFYQRTFTEGGVIGSWATITLLNSKITTRSNFTIAFQRFVDVNSYLSSFVGYVKTTNVPTVEKVVGLSTVTVGTLPASYIPVNSLIFASSVNFVAVFTQSADTNLYVCLNLVEGQYLTGAGGYMDTIKTQVYRVYNTTSVNQTNFYVRFMKNQTSYPRLANKPVKYYVDNIYQATITTDSDGIAALGYSPSDFPHDLAFYMNITDYVPVWVNFTYYSYNPLSIYSSVTEQPVLTITYTDNRVTKNLLMTVTARRFTGEVLTNYYFKHHLKISFRLSSYTPSYSFNDFPLADMLYGTDSGVYRVGLSYTLPYNYVVDFTFNSSLQTGIVKNMTSDSTVSISYASSTGAVESGSVIVIPPTYPLPPEDTGGTSITKVVSLIAYGLPALFVVMIPIVAFSTIKNIPPAIAVIAGLTVGVVVGAVSGIFPLYLTFLFILAIAIIFVYMVQR